MVDASISLREFRIGLFFLLFTVVVSVFVALNFRRDMYQAFSTLAIYIAHCALMAPYCHLLINRNKFYSLLSELEDIVNKSV